MTCTTEHYLLINVNSQQIEITHLNTNKIRVLVGVLINNKHKNDQIVQLFNRKIKGYIDKLLASVLKLSDILFSYQYYWWLSLKYPKPVLSFSKDMNILAKLNAKL